MMSIRYEIDDKEYTKLISNLPLISMDFIIKNKYGKILLGYRKNSPAKNFWFVPGGRIKRMESFDEACKRLTMAELGISYDITKTNFIGIFQHMYDDSSYSKSIGVHYISIGMEVNGSNIKIDELPKSQHIEYQWFKLEELNKSKSVHSKTKEFFQSGNGIK